MLKIEQISIVEPSVLKMERPYAVLLVTKGEGLLNADGQRVMLKAGRVFFLRRDLLIRLEGELLIGQKIEFQELMLHAFLLQFAGHQDSGLYDLSVRLPHVDLEPHRLKPLLDMIAYLHLEMEEGTSVLSFMLQLFLLLSHVNRSKVRPVLLSPERERLYLNLMMLLKERPDSHTTAFYAEKLELTPRQLDKFALLVFRKSFIEVLKTHLMIEADLLLVDKRIRIKDIAYHLGFGSPGDFSHFYKKRKGFSAREFREKWGK